MKLLLCLNKHRFIWDQLDCWESILVQREKGTSFFSPACIKSPLGFLVLRGHLPLPVLVSSLFLKDQQLLFLLNFVTSDSICRRRKA